MKRILFLLTLFSSSLGIGSGVSRTSSHHLHPRTQESHHIYVVKKTDFRVFDNRKHWLTRSQLCQQIKAKEVFPAGYFWPLNVCADGQPCPIGLVVINHHLIHPYLTKKHRPILASGKGKARIFKTYADYFLHRKEWPDAIEGDSTPQDPDRYCYRMIVAFGTRHDRVAVVHTFIMRGTSDDCEDRMTKLRLDQWIYFDGDWSLDDQKRPPIYGSIFALNK